MAGYGGASDGYSVSPYQAYKKARYTHTPSLAETHKARADAQHTRDERAAKELDDITASLSKVCWAIAHTGVRVYACARMCMCLGVGGRGVGHLHVCGGHACN